MLKRWFMNVVILMLVAFVLSGVEYDSAVSLFIAGAILGLVNALIRPLLLVITLPINILTLGVFTFVISALMLQLTAVLVPGFAVASFFAAFVAALLFTLLNLVLSAALR